MRLIDVDELIKSIEQGEGFSWDSHGKDDLCVRKKYIDNAPTVELFCSYLSDGEVRQPCVEAPCKHERPQGKWIFEKADNENTDGYICSECGVSFHTKVPYFSEFNFCPNCGAQMDKGGDV